MVSTIASMGVLISANVAPAMNSMNQMGAKVRDVGQTAQAEGAKTSSFMKQWASAFAVIGAAATGALYMVIKASPLLSGAMQEAQDAISLLFMTIGDALEPILRPFVDLIWKVVDVVTDMDKPLGGVISSMLLFGPAFVGVGIAIKVLLPTLALMGFSISTLMGGFGLIILLAGIVAVALYDLSGDPVVAIVGAFTTIGLGASALLHNPVIAAITLVIGGFALLINSGSDLETAVGLIFFLIGAGAAVLMGNPVIAAITLVLGACTAFITGSNDMKVAIFVVFGAIGGAAALLMGHPVIAAIMLIIDAMVIFVAQSDEAKIAILVVFTAIGVGAAILMADPVIMAIVAIIDAIVILITWWDELGTIFSKPFPILGLRSGFMAPEDWWRGGYQHGGYVPYTGPAFLHAGEYVVPAGRAGGTSGGASAVTNYFDIHDVTLAGDMDVERLKARLDELYKRDIGRRP